MKKPKACHRVIATIAEEMAGNFYECRAPDDQFYKQYPNQEKFIKREWWRFIEMARQSLWSIIQGQADMKMMKEGKSMEMIEHMKLEIMEVLGLDAELPLDGTPIDHKSVHS